MTTLDQDVASAVERLESAADQLDDEKRCECYADGGEAHHCIRCRSVNELYQAAALLTSLAAQIKDYEAVLADKRRLAREIDVALCGEEEAAPQASLCDLVKVAEMKRAELTSLAQEREELREALKPFAREADAWESLPDIATLAMTNPEGDASPFDIRVGELRRARSLLPQEGK